MISLFQEQEDWLMRSNTLVYYRGILEDWKSLKKEFSGSQLSSLMLISSPLPVFRRGGSYKVAAEKKIAFRSLARRESQGF